MAKGLPAGSPSLMVSGGPEHHALFSASDGRKRRAGIRRSNGRSEAASGGSRSRSDNSERAGRSRRGAGNKPGRSNNGREDTSNRQAVIVAAGRVAVAVRIAAVVI